MMLKEVMLIVAILMPGDTPDIKHHVPVLTLE